MSSLDFSVLLNVGLSFSLYLLIHFVIFRFIGSQHVLNMLVVNYLVGALGSIAITLILARGCCQNIFMEVVFGSAALGLYTLICFVYVLCVFGPYESSIRLRLLRDLYLAGSKGKSWTEILENYNSKEILRIRVERFLGSGDLIKEGDVLKIGQHKYIFLFLESTARTLQKIIGIKA